MVALVLLVGGAVLVATRPRSLDTAAVEATVGAELTRRLGATVTVDCPTGARSEAGAAVDCVAADAARGRRTVRVTVLDDAGRYRWALVS